MNDGILKIGNKVYYLKFDINTICNLQDGGVNVLTLDNSIDFKTLRTLLFYGLQSVHRKEIKSLEDAGDVMSDFLLEESLDVFAEILLNALTKSLGKSSAPQGK